MPHDAVNWSDIGVPLDHPSVLHNPTSTQPTQGHIFFHVDEVLLTPPSENLTAFKAVSYALSRHASP